MPTFEVDDQFHSHPKAIRAGYEAVGLWVKAGSWCAAYLTDGRVPRDTAGTWARPSLWQRLIDAGLIEKLPDGDYQMHDFLHWNTPASAIAESRKQAAERKRNYRAANRAKAKCPSGTPPGQSPGQQVGRPRGQVPDVQRPSHGTSRARVPPPPPPPDLSLTREVNVSQRNPNPPAVAGLSRGEDSEAEQEPGPAKRLAGLVWSTFREARKGHYPVRYTAQGGDGPAAKAIAARLAEDLESEGRAADDVEAARQWLRDLWESYFANDGRNGSLRELGHPLRAATGELNTFDGPASTTHSDATARRDEEPIPPEVIRARTAEIKANLAAAQERFRREQQKGRKA